MNFKLITYLLAILALVVPASAQQRQDSVIVSLITCYPGPEVYELCGHEAVRVRGIIDGQPIDRVWNYGTFDYNQPNFIYRFVKGETDYSLSTYPFAWFLPEYQEAGRRVVEQDLNLTQTEARKMLALLDYEALPQNRVYRYNYVKDNCATRILDRLDEAAGGTVVYPDSIRYGTFRNEMRAYHKDYPWYQFGIDLALGSGLDYQLKGKEEMFVPVEMMRKAQYARLPDGRQLVRETRVLNEGVEDATLGPTHWSATPMVCCTIFLILILGICFLQWRRNMIYRAVYSVWFALTGLAGCLLTFLVFISIHEATSPNLLILWLNPLQLIVAAGVWFGRKWRWLTLAVIYLDIILLTVLLIVWPFQAQSANPAFFPLMAATLAMAVSYAILQGKTSLKNKNISADEKAFRIGAVGGGHGGNRSRGKSRSGRTKTASRGRNRR